MTDIVGAVYCEQKAVFDSQLGKNMTPAVAHAARRGAVEHARFEREGLLLAPSRLVAKGLTPRGGEMRQGDRRCYLATHLYGPEALQTHVLRAWRDAVLMPSLAGRLAVRAYYALSPGLARCLPVGTRRSQWLRAVLDAFVTHVETRK